MLDAGSPSRCEERAEAEWSACAGPAAGPLRRRLSRLLCAGWAPHFRVFVRGCLDLPAGVDDDHRPHSWLRGLPTEALPPARRKRSCQSTWIGPSVRDWGGLTYAAGLGLTSRPIAHRNAAISRAMAVVT